MEHPLTSPWNILIMPLRSHSPKGTWVISDRRWYEGSIWIGLPPVIIHCNWIFPYKPSSYWGSPMTMETPILNYHIIGFSFTHHLFWGAPMAMESPMTHWWFTPQMRSHHHERWPWPESASSRLPSQSWLGLGLLCGKKTHQETYRLTNLPTVTATPTKMPVGSLENVENMEKTLSRLLYMILLW